MNKIYIAQTAPTSPTAVETQISAVDSECWSLLATGKFDTPQDSFSKVFARLQTNQFGGSSNTLVSNAGEVQAVSGDELNKQQLASKVSDLLQQNAELLRKTEFYQFRIKFSFKHFKDKWSDNWDVIASNEHLIGVMEHRSGKKFIYGTAKESRKFQALRGYDYYEPNKKNKAPITLKFSEQGLFIDSIAAGASIDGYVNWPGKWRQEVNGVPLYGTNPVTNIKKQNLKQALGRQTPKQ